MGVGDSVVEERNSLWRIGPGGGGRVGERDEVTRREERVYDTGDNAHDLPHRLV